MHENGLLHGRKMKSARIVGDVIGKYHPHGDVSVYDVIIGMGQWFNNNAMFVEKQGNFGSLDGDSPAAMRYTEAKLMPIVSHIVSDIDFVEMVDNYDETLKEPALLPVEFPNILLNGSFGIAVGMASNILPHNLREICDATIAYIKNNDITIKDLCNYIKCPDFPTGGLIAKDDFYKVYENGYGAFSVRSNVELIERGKNQCLVIRDLPFNVNKSKLIENIAYVSRDNKEKKNGKQVIVKAKIDGIRDITDESDLKNPVKIVLLLSKNASPDLVVNQLYKHTNCSVKFNLNMRAIIDGKPELFNLKTVFERFLPFRRSIITNKLTVEKTKIEKRLHILDGLFLVFDKIRSVIKVIEEYRGDDLNAELQNVFKLSKEQATAVLAITLKKLSRIDKQELKSEHEKLSDRKKEIEITLSDIKNVDNIIITELETIRKKYGTPRKTEISSTPFTEINQLDTIPEESMTITLSSNGYIKRTSLSEFKVQKRNGVGTKGYDVGDDDFIKFIKIANSHDDILFFSNKGICYYLPVYMIPEMNKKRKGIKIDKLVNLSSDEKIASMLTTNDLEDGKTLILTSSLGYSKRLDVNSVKKIRKSGLIVAKVIDNDKLIDVSICDDNNDILISTKAGFSLRINAKKVTTIGRGGRGVKTVKLKSDTDRVISTCVINKDDEILTVTEKGYGKKVSVNEYRCMTGRSGTGVINYKVEKYGNVCGVKAVALNDIKNVEILLTTNKSKVIRIPFDSFMTATGRAAKGCRLQTLTNDEKITAFDIIDTSLIK